METTKDTEIRYDNNGNCRICGEPRSCLHKEGCENTIYYEESKSVMEEPSKEDGSKTQLMWIGSQIDGIPFGTILRATRYNTDNQMVIHLWTEDGRSFDVRMNKEYGWEKKEKG